MEIHKKIYFFYYHNTFSLCVYEKVKKISTVLDFNFGTINLFVLICQILVV